MTVTKSFPCAALWTLLIAAAALCQTPPAPPPPPGEGITGSGIFPGIPTAAPGYTAGDSGALGGTGYTTTGAPLDEVAAHAESPAPDNYITYPQPGCCGPMGSGPILMELYFRNGTSTPVGGKRMAQALNTGWITEVGGRSLFFNPERTSAWTVDIGIVNINQEGKHWNVPFELLGTPSTVEALNRTMFSLALGTEFFRRPATCNSGLNCHAGFDFGGRFGTARLDMFDPAQISNYARINGHPGSIYLAVHADVEKSCGCCTWFAGPRVEWDYTWMSVLGGGSDLMSINALVNFGVRF